MNRRNILLYTLAGIFAILGALANGISPFIVGIPAAEKAVSLGEALILAAIGVLAAVAASQTKREKISTKLTEKAIPALLCAMAVFILADAAVCIPHFSGLTSSVRIAGDIINAAGFAAFAAEYAAYESFKPLHEVLLYGAKPIEYTAQTFGITAESVSPASGLSALTLLLSAYCGLDGAEKERAFDMFCAAAKPFFENSAYEAYALAAFNVDSALLREGCRAGEFVSAGTNAMYKEVTLPILADDVVRDFYGGQLSFGTLRRCVAAWLYFKLYRMGGAAKKLGCKICSKLAGGDLNV